MAIDRVLGGTTLGSILIAAAAAFATSASAQENQWRGDYVHSTCKPSETARNTLHALDQSFCHGLVVASWSATQAHMSEHVCIPQGVTYGTAAAVFWKYLDQRPERRHMPAYLLSSRRWPEPIPVRRKPINDRLQKNLERRGGG
jgi:hypothetical protein